MKTIIFAVCLALAFQAVEARATPNPPNPFDVMTTPASAESYCDLQGFFAQVAINKKADGTPIKQALAFGDEFIEAELDPPMGSLSYKEHYHKQWVRIANEIYKDKTILGKFTNNDVRDIYRGGCRMAMGLAMHEQQ